MSWIAPGQTWELLLNGGMWWVILLTLEELDGDGRVRCAVLASNQGDWPEGSSAAWSVEVLRTAGWRVA